MEKSRWDFSKIFLFERSFAIPNPFPLGDGLGIAPYFIEDSDQGFSP